MSFAGQWIEQAITVLSRMTFRLSLEGQVAQLSLKPWIPQEIAQGLL